MPRKFSPKPLLLLKKKLTSPGPMLRLSWPMQKTPYNFMKKPLKIVRIFSTTRKKSFRCSKTKEKMSSETLTTLKLKRSAIVYRKISTKAKKILRKRHKIRLINLLPNLLKTR